MARDANLQLQSEVSKSADFNGTGVTIADVLLNRTLYARVIYKNTSTASGSATADFLVDVSYDGGSTWKSGLFRAATVNMPSGSANAVSGEVHIPFQVVKTSPNTPVQIRLTLDYTASSSPSSPNVTYSSDVVPGGK